MTPRGLHHSMQLAAMCCLVAACKQPAPKCNVAHGAFWAQYTLVSGEGDCAMLTGEELDVQSYYAPRSPSDNRPDYDNVTLAIQPMTITAAIANAAGIADPADGDVPYGLGRFTTVEPEHDFCNVPELAEAQLNLPAVPEHAVDMCTTAPDAPAVALQYKFSNVRIYDTPAAIGTQFSADLIYTQGECTALYKVNALYPMVSCAAAAAADGGASDAATVDASDDGGVGEPDAAAADGGETCPPLEIPGPTTADDSLCANAGINPDFAVVCDPQAQMCVLAKDPPSLR